MQYPEAKATFIEAWGALGLAWGINKTMAQIFALLLLSPDPISVEEIMKQLKVSRGNCSMNLRSLIDWGLVQKHFRPGERREYFFTDRSFWDIAKVVAHERSKRELHPLIKVLDRVQHIEPGPQNREAEHFKKTVAEITEVVNALNQLLQTFVSSDSNWIPKNISKLSKLRKKK